MKTNTIIDPKDLKEVTGKDGKKELVHPTCGKVLPKGEKKVKPGYYIYEFYKIIDLRTQQIASGAPLFIDKITTDVKSNIELRQIALKELTEGRLPFMVERKLPNNKKEYYRIRDLDLVAVRDRIR